MSAWVSRARGMVSANFALVVGCLLILGAVGGWATYTAYAAPGTHVEERQGSWWETAAEFEHAATVVEPNPVYPVGTTLTDRAAYFGTVAPVLNGNLTYGYAASESGSLNVTADAVLVLQAVERNRTGVQTRYWQKTRGLDETETVTVAPGETVRVPFSVNVSALSGETGRINEALGTSLGETEALVRVTVRLSGTVNGEAIERTERYVLPIELGRTTYVVTDSGEMTDRRTAAESVSVPNQYGPSYRFGGPVLLGFGVAGALGLVVTRRSGGLSGPSPVEAERLSFRRARAEFDEWIHTVSLPQEAFELPRAEAESLSDLVDFAIDTNNGVFEDPDGKTYYVVHDGYLYAYAPPMESPAGGSDSNVEADSVPEQNADAPTDEESAPQ